MPDLRCAIASPCPLARPQLARAAGARTPAIRAAVRARRPLSGHATRDRLRRAAGMMVRDRLVRDAGWALTKAAG